VAKPTPETIEHAQKLFQETASHNTSAPSGPGEKDPPQKHSLPPLAQIKETTPPAVVDPHTLSGIAQWQKDLPAFPRSGSPIPPVQTASQTNTSPVLYTKIHNDDLAEKLNPHLYRDGGILSSQIQIGVTFPMKKNVSLAAEINHTVFTGWESANGTPWLKARSEVNGGYERSILDHNPMVTDGLQAPGGERLGISVGMNKSIDLKDKTAGTSTITHHLDVGIRTDISHVSGAKPVQEWWHDSGNANYLRSQENKVQDKTLMGAEATAAYRVGKTSPGHYSEVDGFAGVSAGNGYQGVMLGAQASIGSPSSRYFPTTSHSAQFGNSNLEYTNGNGEAKPGAIRMTAYGNLYASGTKDYRSTTASNDPYTTPFDKTVDIPGAKFGNQYLGDAVITSNPSPNVSTTAVYPQYNIVPYTVTSEHVKLPAALRYDFKPLNFEVGAKLDYQLSHRVELSAELNMISNPVTAHVNSNYKTAYAAVSDHFEGTSQQVFTRNTKPGETLTPHDGYTPQNPGQYSVQENVDFTVGDGQPQIIADKAPGVSFGGQVSVHVALGKRGGRGR